MSRHSAMPSAEVEVLAVQRRRRFSAEEKQRMVQETYQPGMTLSKWLVHMRFSPSLLFRRRPFVASRPAPSTSGRSESGPAGISPTELVRLHQGTHNNRVENDIRPFARERSLCTSYSSV